MKDEYTKDGRLVISKPAPSPEDIVVVSRSMSKELDWEPIRACIKSKSHDQYGTVDMWALDKAIKALLTAKEDALRKDLIETIRAKHGDHIGDAGTVVDEILSLLKDPT